MAAGLVARMHEKVIFRRPPPRLSSGSGFPDGDRHDADDAELHPVIVMTIAEALFAVPAAMVSSARPFALVGAVCFIPVAALLGSWVMAFTSWTLTRVRHGMT